MRCDRIRHRGFEIYPHSGGPFDGHYIWQHASYDGPGDDRHGVAKTVDLAIAAIDAFIAEEEAHEAELAKEAGRC